MTDQVRDDTKHYFYAIHHDFLDRYLAEMKGSTLKVFMALCRHVSFSTGQGKVTLADILETSGCCHNTAVDAFSELEEFGILRREMKPGIATTYVINQNLDSPQKLVGVKESNPPQELGGDSPQKLVVTPPKKQTHLEKRDIEIRESSAPEIDTVQRIIPWMEKQWREDPSTHKLPWRKFNYPREVEELAERVGQAAFRAAWLEHIRAPDPNQFGFLRVMRDNNPRPKSTRSNGNGKSHSKTVTEMFYEAHPELVGK